MTVPNEEHLLGQFRRLNAEGRKELLNFAALLLQKQGLTASTEGQAIDGQCPLRKEEKHPEAAAEPVFTE